jgi:hypothetical protein
MYTYELNCSQYVLCRDGRPILRPLDEVALAVSCDDETGLITLHKHGEPDRIAEWFKTMRAKLSTAGLMGVRMADEMLLVQGRFDIEQLNAAINRNQAVLRALVHPQTVIDVECVEIRG